MKALCERLLKSGFTMDDNAKWTVQFQQFVNKMYFENIKHTQEEINKLKVPTY